MSVVEKVWAAWFTKKVYNIGKSVIGSPHIVGMGEDRTFVLTALDQSFSQLDRLHRLPAGMDVQTPKLLSRSNQLHISRKRSLPSVSTTCFIKHGVKSNGQMPHCFNGVLSMGGVLSSEIS
jgi:hypothetical protein